MKVLALSPAGRDIVEVLDAAAILIPPERIREADLVIVDGDFTPAESSARVLRLDSGGIESMLDDCLRVGEAIGRASEAERLAVGLRNRLFEASEVVNPFDDGPNVAFLVGVEPPRLAGGWIVQLIERAGGRSPWNPTVARYGTGAAAGPQHGERRAGPGFEMAGSEFVEYPAEAIVVCVEGADAAACRERASGLLAMARFASQPAVRSGRVAFVDGRGTFHRKGPRLVDGFEWLTTWLNGRDASGCRLSWLGM